MKKFSYHNFQTMKQCFTMPMVFRLSMFFIVLLLSPLSQAQNLNEASKGGPIFGNLDQVIYQDAAHAYDDDQVIMLSKMRVPVLQSRLVPVQKGDNFVVEVNTHYTRNNKEVWTKIGATAAGLAIGSLPYLLNSRPETGKEGSGSGDLLKKVAPLAGAGVATLPFIFNKRKDKRIGRKVNPPKLRNGLFVPNAYLKYNFYDGEGVLLESDYMALDKNAKGNWQKLYLTKQVEQDGFVSIEMGNNSRRPVWFDQMKLTHSSRGQKMDAAGEPGEDLSLEGGDDVTTNKVTCDLICVTTPYGTTCNTRNCRDDGTGTGTGPGWVDDPVEDCMLYYGDADFCDCYVFGQCDDGESPFNPPGGGGGGGHGDSDNSLETTRPITHPGTINYKDASPGEIAVQLLKAIRYAQTYGIEINLSNYFTNLDNHYHSGTHVTFNGDIKINGITIPLYIEIPHHGPEEGLTFDRTPNVEYNDDGTRWNMRYGEGNFGILISIQDPSKRDLLYNYLNYN